MTALIAILFMMIFGCVIILGIAFGIRTYITKRFRFPILLAGIHSAILLIFMMMFPLEFLFPYTLIPSPPFDDLYMPYYIIPGFHIYIICGKITSAFTSSLFLLLPNNLASIAGIVYIPGIVGLFIGGIQWFWIGNLLTKFSKKWG